MDKSGTSVNSGSGFDSYVLSGGGSNSNRVFGSRPSKVDPVDAQLKAFYDSCMDVDNIRKKGTIPGKKETFFK